MEKTNFENLRIYQIAEQSSDSIWEVVKSWPSLAQDTVRKQMVRAADSIGANIAEGDGKGSQLDNRRFLLMARGSLYETKHWMRRATQRQLLTEPQQAHLQPMIDDLLPKLNAYLRWLNQKIKN